MKEKLLLRKAKEEAAKIQKQAAAYFVPDKNNKTSHCEIRFRNEDGTLGTRGFVLHKVGDKINNGELFEPKIEGLLNLLFNFEDPEVAVKKKKIELKKYNFTLKIKPAEKKVRYYINDQLVFTLRKVRSENGTYIVSGASLSKAAQVLELTLISYFRTNVEDFNVAKDLISAVAEYLLVI